MRLPPPERLGEGGLSLNYFWLGDVAFALKPWLIKSYSRRQPSKEDSIGSYRISEAEGGVVQIAFGILLDSGSYSQYRSKDQWLLET